MVSPRSHRFCSPLRLHRPFALKSFLGTLKTRTGLFPILDFFFGDFLVTKVGWDTLFFIQLVPISAFGMGRP